MASSLTYYFNTANATVSLSASADVLTHPGTPAGVAVSKNSLIGTSTGYGEAWSRGNASAWAAGSSLPSTPTGNGWIDDSTLLEGQCFASANWTPTIRLSTSVGSIVANTYYRIWKYNAGSYTLLQTYTDNGSGSGRTINTTGVTINFTAANPGALSFTTGDRLYISVDVNILSNSTGSSSANLKITTCSTTNDGVATAQLVTPGYTAYTAETLTETATGSESVLVATPVLLLAETATDSTLESVTAVGVAFVSPNETATGSELIAATAITLNPVVESASGTESVTEAAIALNPVVESATGSESITATAITNFSLTETATDSTLEAVNVIAIALNTITESATGSESVSTDPEEPTGETLEYDTFKRTAVANGWGTATDGNAWYNRQGAATSLSTDGNHAYLASSGGVRSHLTLGLTTYNDQDNTIKGTYGTTNDDVGITGRMSGDASISGVNGYRYSVPGNGGASTNGVLYKVVQGVATLLATGANTTIGTANKYVFRMVVSGQTTPRIQAKFWINGHLEPSLWDVDYTDTDTINIFNAGAPGVTGIASTATAIQYDNFNSDAPGEALNVQSVQESATGSEVLTLNNAFNQTITETDAGSELVVLTNNFNQSVIETNTGSEAVNVTLITLALITEAANGSEIVRATDLGFAVVVESATGSELVSTSVLFNASITEGPSGTELLSVLNAFNQTVIETGGGETEVLSSTDYVTLTITETTTGSESVVTLTIIQSPANTQMAAADLAYEYARILASNVGPELRLLATTYYGNATNSQVVYGELDALLEYESIQNLHVMRTINDVNTFLKSYSYVSSVLSDSPAVYYRLGEPVGAISAYDISGRAMTASINGTVVAGQSGALAQVSDTAMLFNGGYIALPAAVNTANWNALTMEAWINPSNITFNNVARILANDIPATSNLGVALAVTKNSVVFRMGTGNTNYVLTQAYTFAANTWYHLVAVFTGTKMIVYLNGTQLGTNTTASGLIGQTTNLMYISRNPGDLVNGFPGTLDEVAIYNTALSAARVAAHYTAGTTP